MVHVLYHYTSGEGLLGILQNKEFWASNVKYLNDPTEPLYFGKLLRTLLKQNPKCNAIFDFFYDQQYVDDFYDDSVYVISFCQSDNELTMWRNYAHGNGYNIGIDINAFENFLNVFSEKYDIIENGIPIYPYKIKIAAVIYDKEEQINMLKKTIVSGQIISSILRYFLYIHIIYLDF